jgi:hypothetical protein
MAGDDYKVSHSVLRNNNSSSKKIHEIFDEMGQPRYLNRVRIVCGASGAELSSKVGDGVRGEDRCVGGVAHLITGN